jgi:hypothetical protein
LGSTTLLFGECHLTKNNMIAGKSLSTLLYDQDLGFLKVVAEGNIWMSFRPDQISGSRTFTTGTIIKRYAVEVIVKFPNGDEYGLAFYMSQLASSMEVKTWIDNLAMMGRCDAEVMRLLKMKERVPMSEVSVILSQYRMPSTSEQAMRLVGTFIASGKVDGILEGEWYVSRLAKQRETVNYQVVTSFDITSAGTISLKCPNCGSAVSIDRPSHTRRCDYCKAEFAVPKRILDLL